MVIRVKYVFKSSVHKVHCMLNISIKLVTHLLHKQKIILHLQQNVAKMHMLALSCLSVSVHVTTQEPVNRFA
jgi:hypothetical protein